MRSIIEVEKLLDELNNNTADDMEGQDLEFKQWNERSMQDSIGTVVEAAICMANGEGGTVVFGVADKVIGRTRAILGVPNEVDVNLLKKAVYDKTDPKITPVFEELHVHEGTGRLLIMHIYTGMPPYTDTAGSGTVRIGKDCQPLTGTMRRRISVETGETDFTAETITGNLVDLLSPAAMEQLRDLARRETAPQELTGLSDHDLIASLRLMRDSRLTRAGLLIAGKSQAIPDSFPGYVWTYLKMEGDALYTNRTDSREALPIALLRLEELIDRDNPITTVEYGFFHFEYRTYPLIALREALLNALCHADYRVNSPIMVKHYVDRIEISNPGGFIGGVSASNILHHPPVSRNPLLVDALLRLRLVNRSNLGISRMYQGLLIEGKEPPTIEEIEGSVRVTFLHQEFSGSFRAFFEEESRSGATLKVDELIILRYLLSHSEMDTATAASRCQRSESMVWDLLCGMERKGYVERGGTGRGTYWVLPPQIHKKLAGPGHPERDRRIDWDAAKTRILSVLKDREKRGEKGLSNEEVRQITHYDRAQVRRLMKQLMKENDSIIKTGERRWTRYELSL
ncbi:MAG: ATP-binding protein [Desulfomonile sp.]